MPQHQYTAWVIGEGLSTEAAELVAAVAHHGLLFMRSHLELQAILTGIRQRLGYDHQLVYRLPVVLALLGDHDAAKAALGRSLAELGGRQDGAAVDLREFAEAFGRWEARVS